MQITHAVFLLQALNKKTRLQLMQPGSVMISPKII